MGAIHTSIRNELTSKDKMANYGINFYDKYSRTRNFSGILKPDRQDQKLVEVGKSIGLKYIDAVSVYYSDNTNTEDFKDPDGTYDDIKHEIVIRKGLSDSAEKELLAHEYLHFMWYEPETLLYRDVYLANDLMAVYENNEKLKNQLEIYKKHNRVSTTELLSYSCTILRDDELTPYLVQ